MEIVNNTVYFESDAEFEDFSIAPFISVKTGDTSYHGDYSDLYKQYLEEGKSFVIMDRNSVVYKRKSISKRVQVLLDGKPMGREVCAQLRAKNLEPWFGLTVPHKFRDTFARLLSENPQTTYHQIAETLNISEKRAYEFLKMWKKEAK